MRYSPFALLLLILGAGACQTDPTAPPPVLSLALARVPHFLSPAAGAPAVANPVVSFYAKRGETRQVTMVYHARPGATDSTVFVRFTVGAKALLARPDGTPLTRGDSVLITLTLTDPASLAVDFQPAGLRFNPRDPAELRMSYAEADPDLNGDGAVDRQDTSLTRKLQIWRRETDTDPWLALPSTVTLELHEVETQVTGFTRYAVAY